MSVINNYLKKYAFIFQTNEIYGGIENLWDYGHLGVLLKENIKKRWINFFVTTKKESYLFDGSIFGSEDLWKASGHLNHFNDFLIDCKDCKKRFRDTEMKTINKCIYCLSENLTEKNAFNLMFKADKYYLRPETAQSIFINFKNFTYNGAKMPFSVAQIGKSFRNEVTIKNSIFRTREFEQMELEIFSSKKDSDHQFKLILNFSKLFLLNELNIKEENIKFIHINKEGLAHYSIDNYDIYFKFDHGWSELCGIANRGNFDLTSHSENSKVSLHYVDSETQIKEIPYIIEQSIGLNRLLLAIITNSYYEDEERIILKIKPSLAPYQFAVLPLSKENIEEAEKLFELLSSNNISTKLDIKGSIGKRYRYHDAIGTPFCISLDNKNTFKNEESLFLVRFRDNKKQIYLNLKDLLTININNLENKWKEI